METTHLTRLLVRPRCFEKNLLIYCVGIAKGIIMRQTFFIQRRSEGEMTQSLRGGLEQDGQDYQDKKKVMLLLSILIILSILLNSFPLT
jgi:hypothetical protein